MAKDKENELKRLEDYSREELESMLRGIRAKMLANKSLSPEEKLLWTEYAEKVNMLEEQEKIESETEARELEEKKQEELLSKFDSLPAEEKLEANVEGTYLNKGAGKFSEIKSKFWMDRVTTKAKKKGGAIIEKGYLDSSIEIIWVANAKTFIEFMRVDENNNKVRSIARVTKTKHRLKGTSVPIHIAIEGISENVNLLEGVNTSLSAQHINQMNQLCYQAGFFDALDAKDLQKKFDLGGASIILLLIILAAMLYLAWQQYQLFELVSALSIPAVA